MGTPARSFASESTSPLRRIVCNKPNSLLVAPVAERKAILLNQLGLDITP